MSFSSKNKYSFVEADLEIHDAERGVSYRSLPPNSLIPRSPSCLYVGKTYWPTNTSGNILPLMLQQLAILSLTVT